MSKMWIARVTKNTIGAVDKDEICTKHLDELLLMLSDLYDGSAVDGHEVLEIHITRKESDEYPRP